MATSRFPAAVSAPTATPPENGLSIDCSGNRVSTTLINPPAAPLPYSSVAGPRMISMLSARSPSVVT